MSDTIGRIVVPSAVLSTGGSGISGTQIFPLTTQYPFGFSVYMANLCPFYVGAADRRSRRREIIVHNNGGVCKRFLTATGE